MNSPNWKSRISALLKEGLDVGDMITWTSGNYRGDEWVVSGLVVKVFPDPTIDKTFPMVDVLDDHGDLRRIHSSHLLSVTRRNSPLMMIP